MAASSKNTRTQSRLEKAARENHNLSVDYEVQAKIIREKTARLKALRLEKEAVDKKNSGAQTFRLNYAYIRNSARHLRARRFFQCHISIRNWPGMLTGAKSASWWDVRFEWWSQPVDATLYPERERSVLRWVEDIQTSHRLLRSSVAY